MWLATWLLALLWVGYASFGRRWRVEPKLAAPRHAGFPDRVVAVVPARNEASELPHSLPSLLQQSHRPLKVVVVDDHSEDDTAGVALRIAKDLGVEDRLEVLASSPLEPGWTGKVWAQAQGVDRAATLDADWIWFTDADIRHDPRTLQRLLTTAAAGGRDFVSVMARLRCESSFEKLLIPAFTYFFAALYSFGAIGDDASPAAGAAGGCMLVRRHRLEQAGGLRAIRDAVIDDVALGAACKASGARLWLGYDEGIESSREYQTLSGVWNMVARSAYTQLGYNPLALVVCVFGLAYIFWLPILMLFGGQGTSRLAALLACLAMARTYLPILRHLGCHGAWAATLPVAAALYAGMTLTSAWRFHAGSGNAWKGRTYDTGASSSEP